MKTIPHYLTLCILFACTLFSQANPVITVGARELTERVLKTTSREGVEELASLGGREGVEALMRAAVREGGPELGEKVVHYGSRYGAQALRAIQPSPAAYIRALDELPEHLIRPALGAIERNPEFLTPLVKQFGAQAIRAELRHPGIAAPLLRQFGDEGVELSEKLSTDQLISLARHSDSMAALAAPQRSKVVTALAQAPEAVLGALNRNPKVLLTAGGVASIAVVANQALKPSTNKIIQPDGTVIESSTSAFDLASTRFNGPMKNSIYILVITIAGGIAAWFAIKLFPGWRKSRRRAN